MRPVNSIDELLEHMVARDASDLHVTVGTPPVIRVRGEIERVADYSPLTPEETQELLYRILSSEQQKNLEIKRQLDFSHSIPGLARFRVNVYFQRESIGAAFRLIPAEIKTLEELGIPATLHQLAECCVAVLQGVPVASDFLWSREEAAARRLIGMMTGDR